MLLFTTTSQANAVIPYETGYCTIQVLLRGVNTIRGNPNNCIVYRMLLITGPTGVENTASIVY